MEASGAWPALVDCKWGQAAVRVAGAPGRLLSSRAGVGLMGPLTGGTTVVGPQSCSNDSMINLLVCHAPCRPSAATRASSARPACPSTTRSATTPLWLTRCQACPRTCTLGTWHRSAPPSRPPSSSRCTRCGPVCGVMCRGGGGVGGRGGGRGAQPAAGRCSATEQRSLEASRSWRALLPPASAIISKHGCSRPRPVKHQSQTSCTGGMPWTCCWQALSHPPTACACGPGTSLGASSCIRSLKTRPDLCLPCPGRPRWRAFWRSWWCGASFPVGWTVRGPTVLVDTRKGTNSRRIWGGRGAAPVWMPRQASSRLCPRPCPLIFF